MSLLRVAGVILIVPGWSFVVVHTPKETVGARKNFRFFAASLSASVIMREGEMPSVLFDRAKRKDDRPRCFQVLPELGHRDMFKHVHMKPSSVERLLNIIYNMYISRCGKNHLPVCSRRALQESVKRLFFSLRDDKPSVPV